MEICSVHMSSNKKVEQVEAWRWLREEECLSLLCRLIIDADQMMTYSTCVHRLLNLIFNKPYIGQWTYMSKRFLCI